MTDLAGAAFAAGYAAAGVAGAGYGTPVGPVVTSYEPISGGTVLADAPAGNTASAAAAPALATGDAAIGGTG